MPISILPELRNTDEFFGNTHSAYFGYPIPIHDLIRDQSAATFGECFFDLDDFKITIFIASFVNVNSGNKLEPSMNGIYPLIGCKLKNGEITYLLEASSNDSGTNISWAQSIELFNQPAQGQSYLNQFQTQMMYILFLHFMAFKHLTITHLRSVQLLE